MRRRGSKLERDFGAAQEFDEALFGEHSSARTAVGVITIEVTTRAAATASFGQHIRDQDVRLCRPVCGKEDPVSLGAPAAARSSLWSIATNSWPELCPRAEALKGRAHGVLADGACLRGRDRVELVGSADRRHPAVAQRREVLGRGYGKVWIDEVPDRNTSFSSPVRESEIPTDRGTASHADVVVDLHRWNFG